MDSNKRLDPWLKAFRLIFWLYVFMISVKLMGASFKVLGSQFDIKGMLTEATAHPVMGVCVGLLATALVQSSSFTTSMLVTLVATGMIDLPHAIPIIMGANIGTTITNNLVATAHVARRQEFRLAFSAGTVHDIFNVLTVLILLPIEVMFHPLQRSALFLTTPIRAVWTGEGGKMGKGPINAVLYPVVDLFKGLLHWVSDNPTFIGCGLLLIAVILLFLALSRMVKVLKQVFMGRVEQLVDEYLFKRWWTALLFGAIITALVQSSSMTVSLLVPMVAGGILTLEKAFPFTLGANLGTTLTAFMAAVVTGSPVAISLALTHLLFNIFGSVIFLPLRKIPISISNWFAAIVYRHRWFALVYILVGFFIIPIGLIAFIRFFIN